MLRGIRKAKAEGKYKGRKPSASLKCEFRFNPAGDSDFIPATIPI
jgi:hypothetical protein